MSFSPALVSYRIATAALSPFAGAWLGARARNGKEDPTRLDERFGRYAQERPASRLVWLHAASVGESGVAMQIIDALATRDAALSFLLTTGTRTSAELIARRRPPRTFHAYAPIDSPGVARRFFDHWRPNLGVFVESELWPHLILEAERRCIPLALVNARMSPASLRRWQAWPKAGQRLMGAFAVAAAADARTADALTLLKGATVPMLGNLKLAAAAPEINAEARAMLAAEIGTRKVWLAASTHPGEDEIALTAHQRLRETFPDALLILAPRHPERGSDVSALAKHAPRRALNDAIKDAPVYIADTMGEMGALYDAAPVALIAGSLLAHLKGHNPIEPAKLGAAIIHGPHVESFEDVYTALSAAGGACSVSDSESLAIAVARLWRDDAARNRQNEAARAVVSGGANALDETIERLAQLLNARRADASA